MKSVSVSELQKWRFCRRAWEFSYDYEITNPSMSPTASSGIAVHDAIAKVLKGDITRKQIPGYVEQVLTKLFLNKEDMYTQVKKFLPGALRAIAWTPDWIWKKGLEWHVEERLEVVLIEDSDEAEGVTLKFVPDVYCIETQYMDGIMGPPIEVTFIDIFDFKTGKKEALDYFLHSPQLTYYAVALSKLFSHLDPIIRINYISLPTGDRDKPVEHEPWMLSVDQLKEAEEELIEGIREVGEKARWASRDTHCGFCDFRRICSTRMLGGDWRSVIRDDYIKRDRNYQ